MDSAVQPLANTGQQLEIDKADQQLDSAGELLALDRAAEIYYHFQQLLRSYVVLQNILQVLKKIVLQIVYIKCVFWFRESIHKSYKSKEFIMHNSLLR